MKKLALSMVVGGLAAAVAVPALATTTTAPPASLTYARAATTSDAAPPAYAARFKARRALWLKVRGDFQKHRETMRPLRRQAMILKLELKILMLRDKLDKKAILAKVKQIADVKGKIMAKRIFFRLAMKKKYPELRGFGRKWRGHRGFRRGFRQGGPCFGPGGGPGRRGGPGFRGRGFRRGPGMGPGPMGPGPR